MKFNQKLINLRTQKNLSQDELGKELKVARQTISKWESGETTPSMKRLVQMSDLFEVTLDELIKGEEDKFKKLEILNKKAQKLANYITIMGTLILILMIIGIILR